MKRLTAQWLRKGEADLRVARKLAPSQPPAIDFVCLVRFAVDFRYPGFHARRSQANAALRWAERVRVEVRTILRLPAHMSRRRP